MTLYLNGTTGISGVDGSAGTPAVQGTDTNTGISFPAADTIAFNEGGAEAMRIDSSSRLLVGTSSSSATVRAVFQDNSDSTGPGHVLLATSSSVPTSAEALGRLRFSAANHVESVQIEASRDGGTWTAGSSQPSKLTFSTTADSASSPTERLRIGQNGFFKASNLGSYNDTSGNYHEFRSSVNSFQILRVEHTSNVSGNGTFSSVLGSNCNNTSSYHFVANAGGDRMFVYGNGNIVNTNNSYGSLSDVKLKENIVNANSQWDDLKALQVRNYNFKEGQTHTQIGLVAQEVELVSPGLVSESPDRDEDGNDLGTVTKSVNYSVLYMKAVKALQEAMERIEQLEAEMAEVKAQLS